MMERQVNHMVRLVDDLMEVSRITRGKIELRQERLDVATIVRNALETSQPLIDASRHRLFVSMPKELLQVEGDPVRLSQVISNLLNNAAKYTDPGGQITLAVRRDDTHVEITVSDSGVGIAPEMLPRVFDMFTQVASSTDRAQGGLGIGLTLVKSLVEMHHGTIEARSAGLGRGSQFVIRLPLACGHAANGLPAPNVPSPAIPERRVLIVDDNRDAAESLAMLLKLLGAKVQVAHNGFDALSQVSEFHPAIVVLDLGMPGMDGYEVAREIRRQPEFAHVVLVALTGWAQDEDRLRSQNAGFNLHLTKPADFATFESLLQSLSNDPSPTVLSQTFQGSTPYGGHDRLPVR
jgi:CheY-like chemotaxis protein